MPNQKPRILFVDDEPALLEGLKRALHKMSQYWHMTFTTDTHQVISICEQANCDLLVTDLRMPEMDGISLVRYFNQHFPQTSCMMLTGTADLNDAAQLINTTSIAGFFEKPCDIAMLIEGIKRELQRRQQNIELEVPTAEDLRQNHGLTPAEARLAHALLLGETLEQAAEKNGITLSSARTYLKRIFSKTNTNRQAELIRKLITRR